MVITCDTLQIHWKWRDGERNGSIIIKLNCETFKIESWMGVGGGVELGNTRNALRNYFPPWTTL